MNLKRKTKQKQKQQQQKQTIFIPKYRALNTLNRITHKSRVTYFFSCSFFLTYLIYAVLRQFLSLVTCTIKIQCFIYIYIYRLISHIFSSNGQNHSSNSSKMGTLVTAQHKWQLQYVFTWVWMGVLCHEMLTLPVTFSTSLKVRALC